MINIENIHPIQKHILLVLTQSKTALFTQMRPKDILNDKYNYHLKHLISQKLIQKEKNVYSLTLLGLQTISNMSIKGHVQQFFKVSVALFIVNTTENKILLQKRLRQPFYGDINSFTGKVKLGESVTDTAKRKMKEECGLNGDFTIIGIHRKMKYFKNVLVEDAVYHDCYCQNPKGKLQELNSFGENFWCDFKIAISTIKKSIDVCEDDIKIMKNVINGPKDLFYIESRLNLTSY